MHAAAARAFKRHDAINSPMRDLFIYAMKPFCHTDHHTEMTVSSKYYDDYGEEGILSTDDELPKDHDIRMMTLRAFSLFLKSRGVPLEKYGVGRARSCKHLWAEVVLCLCRLERCGPSSISIRPGMSRTLRREVGYVVLELCANINGSDRVLLLKDQEEEMGIDRLGVYEPPMLHMLPDEKPSDAVIRLVVQLLNVPEKHCKKHFSFECTAVKRLQESIDFPGLLTFYKVKKMRVHIRDPHNPDLMCLGLPHGDDFETSVKWIMCTHTNVFTWASREKFEKESFFEKDTELDMDSSDVDEFFSLPESSSEQSDGFHDACRQECSPKQTECGQCGQCSSKQTECARPIQEKPIVFPACSLDAIIKPICTLCCLWFSVYFMSRA